MNDNPRALLSLIRAHLQHDHRQLVASGRPRYRATTRVTVRALASLAPFLWYSTCWAGRHPGQAASAVVVGGANAVFVVTCSTLAFLSTFFVGLGVSAVVGFFVSTFIAGAWIAIEAPAETDLFIRDWKRKAPPTIVAPLVGALAMLVSIYMVCLTRADQESGWPAYLHKFAGLLLAIAVIAALVLFWSLPLAERETLLEGAAMWAAGLIFVGCALGVFFAALNERRW